MLTACLLALSYSGAAVSARLGHIALARTAWNGAAVKSAAYPRAERAALRMADEQEEESERPPRTSVYQILGDEQIANIHDVADALVSVCVCVHMKACAFVASCLLMFCAAAHSSTFSIGTVMVSFQRRR